VVVLSDGLTEQTERAELLRLISSRPRNTRVFCVGVGNDVNRPLLEQLAEDSGGLCAFLSRGDNFERQAQAFRRKLMRPAAAGLKVDLKGVTVYDVEPAVLPDLYHGSPIRLYGRYKGSGTAQVAVSADVRGLPFRQGGDLSFPGEDTGNPEIERMWAWKRIDRLLKTADRTDARASVKDQVVALGEAYSIVSEYTSFLVLENDAEFQRWQIERRNVARTGRDRKAQERRQELLDALRTKALADLGPQAAERAAEAAKPPQAPGVPAASPASASPGPATRPSNGVDLSIGTGPVGVLFVFAAAWLRRRRAACA
jgi:Ca-activated chloride channel family protein